ncbi:MULTISPECIES: flavin reductase family protein [Microbacterium]|uniref:NADH-FMN oxidoreductase RutF, flavin reductase (DIM6/NTAB) family n=1 Tax=Microbacterium saccharophilum TaxID=1213358 RepID=A0A7Z7CYM6_9MICO|nr:MULTISPECIES: flavin reductase family protein [Microbacterium]SFI61452.1 NADH-FMN oxidoreductase RutF, flavin reductase (DIM6/NTAB) family [Microbacterium saccharophilum]
MTNTNEGTGDLAPALATADEFGESITPDELKSLFRGHPAGVAVITADAGDGPVGMTASSVFSVSVAPPLIVFSASALSSSTPTLLEADTIVVHMIGTQERDIAVLCATSGIDRFADTSLWDRLPTGEPYFRGASRRFRGRVVNRLAAGASTLFVVKAIESWHDGAVDSQPLVYHDRTWHALGESSRIS